MNKAKKADVARDKAIQIHLLVLSLKADIEALDEPQPLKDNLQKALKYVWEQADVVGDAFRLLGNKYSEH